MRRITILALAGVVAATGCGGGGGFVPHGGSVGPGAFMKLTPSSPSYGSLQFAVGTANLYGARVGLNVVSTFRQGDGASAVGVDTPKVSGPFRILASAVPSFAESSAYNAGFPDPYTTVFNGGPSAREVHGTSVTGTPQTVAPGTPSCDGSGPFPPAPPRQKFVRCPAGLSPNTTTFGQSGGVFAMGIQPANAVAATGQAYSYQPYPEPAYASSDVVSHYQFVPWGGPPAFDPDRDHMGTRDGLILAGFDSFGDPFFLGVGEGITVFDGTQIKGGTYSMTVAISTTGSGGVTTSYVTKTAHLNAADKLPAVAAPVVHFDGKGGAYFTTHLPPRVTQAYIQIVDWGPDGGPARGSNGTATPPNCQKARGTKFAPVYYTFEITSHKPKTYRLPDNDGPNLATSGGAGNLQPSPSICTSAQNTAANGSKAYADDIVVQMIGFDYPVYQAALGLTLATTPQNPPIKNASGQADITISQAAEQDDGSTNQTPLK